jgi:hypothetical protein
MEPRFAGILGEIEKLRKIFPLGYFRTLGADDTMTFVCVIKLE